MQQVPIEDVRDDTHTRAAISAIMQHLSDRITTSQAVTFVCATLGTVAGLGFSGVEAAVIGGVVGFFVGKTLESFQYVVHPE